MNDTKGRLIVVSGPSGAGKTTVITRVMSLRDDLVFSVSATTRPPRKGEREGVSYFFVSREEFDRLVERDQLLECAQYAGNMYGTPRGPIQAHLSQGKSVILDIEVQGAAQVREKMPEAVTVFLTPSRLSVLEERLRIRNQDSEEKIQIRVRTARGEAQAASGYDYIIFNDNLETATAELSAVITAEACRASERFKKLIKE